jgi:hypothetical protein
VRFEVDEPWTLYEMPDLRVVVAGLNPTIRESHRDEDHYGSVGEAQLRWFSDRLRTFEERGWLRIGVVHHNPRPGAEDDEENLRDVEDLERILAPRLNLALYGHTHRAMVGRLGGGLPVLAAGSAAIRARTGPSEVPNQYQILQIRADRITRWARRYEPDQRCWVGDSRISEDGDSWWVHTEEAFTSVRGAFPDAHQLEKTRLDRDREIDLTSARDDFLDRVAEVCTLRHTEKVIITRARSGTPPLEYLRVTTIGRQYPVGAYEHGIDAESVERFIDCVHDVYRIADQWVESEIVYGGRRLRPRWSSTPCGAECG